MRITREENVPVHGIVYNIETNTITISYDAKVSHNGKKFKFILVKAWLVNFKHMLT